MSVVGIIILVTLLLILKLISQMAVAEPIEVPEITEAELNGRIESLEQNRREIESELARLNQAKQTETPYIPSLSQIDTLRASVERLKADTENIKEDIRKTQDRQNEINNNAAAKLIAELEKNISELEQQHTELQNQSSEQIQRQKDLQTTIGELKKQLAELDSQLSVEMAKKIFAIPNKATDKTPYILVYGQGPITVLSENDPMEQTFASTTAFLKWVDERDRKTEYIVLYVRPSRFGDYKNVLDGLKRREFDTGLQVLGEDTEITLRR